MKKINKTQQKNDEITVKLLLFITGRLLIRTISNVEWFRRNWSLKIRTKFAAALLTALHLNRFWFPSGFITVPPGLIVIIVTVKASFLSVYEIVYKIIN